MRKSFIFLISVNLFILSSVVSAQTDETFKIFRFPANMIPRIDGNTADWNIVPDSYIIGTDRLKDDEKKHPAPDPFNLDIKVKTGIEGPDGKSRMGKVWDVAVRSQRLDRDVKSN